MLNTFRARSSCEQEAKFVQDRVVLVERTTAELCHIFSQYTRKAARLRDKGDEIARVTFNHAGTETINKTLSLALENFADNISLLSSYGDLRVQNLDLKVIKELSKYESNCKQAKDDVKQMYNAREKEIGRQRQLDRIKERNPRNRQQIMQAETELVKASAEFSKAVRNLEEKSIDFERQKLHDIKSILLDFVSVEMGFHAKALEVLSNAFKSINSINEDSDLEDFEKVSKQVEADFKRALRVPNTGRTQRKKPIFRASTSLGSLGGIFSTTSQKSQGIPKGFSKSDETLASSKQRTSDSDEEVISASVSDTTQSNQNDSPIRTKRYTKK